MTNTTTHPIKMCFKKPNKSLTPLLLFVFLTATTGCIVQESTSTRDGNNSVTNIKNEGSGLMTKMVGSSKIGYIYLPETFLRFRDAVSEGVAQDLQYSDGGSIFTLNVFQHENHTLESAANSIAGNWEMQGVQNIEGASIDINGYNCLQIYGDYNNGTHKAVAYVIQGGNQFGSIHLVTFEGPIEFLKDNLGYAETFVIE
ncbi:hypothetical protein L4D06_19400 [Enterovibrio makurazakiensis]|uniref:hypothetical protein n=1 Tax=Enterovibrio makurazakiensis TaxID=2910232 RepID=UPI003D2638CE